MHTRFCLFFTFRLPLPWWEKPLWCFQENVHPWAVMCEKESKGSRWGGSSPGAGEVVLQWYFLAGSWLCWERNLRELVFIPLFIRLSSTPFEAYLDLQDISFSSGECTEPKGFLTRLLSSDSVPVYRKLGSVWWLGCVWRSWRCINIHS